MLNDVPGALVQLRRSLVAGGLFMANVIGHGSLAPLQEVLMQAELDVCGGVSPRMAAFIDGAMLAALLQRAGFIHNVVDEERITESVPNLHAAMQVIRRLGDSNCLNERQRNFTKARLFKRAEELWQKKNESTLTFHLLTATAYRPDKQSHES